jgi:putative serine protease PepD
VVGALAALMVAALLGGVADAFLVSRGERDNASPLPAAPAGSTVRPSGSIADIASRVLPSVVTIKVQGPAGQGTGSGFVVRKDGYILTNNHVVDAAGANAAITVLFSDGTSVDATVIGHDAAYDLAVIRGDPR